MLGILKIEEKEKSESAQRLEDPNRKDREYKRINMLLIASLEKQV